MRIDLQTLKFGTFDSKRLLATSTMSSSIGQSMRTSTRFSPSMISGAMRKVAR